ncbi:MAG: hypothetical protein HRU07_04555 [Nitrosopumilus sp.]|nr:hypothetical protein [Nitrosopumilus sp.]NRA05424.1 hypothetical protein [Nitrosopumilus sp.]
MSRSDFDRVTEKTAASGCCAFFAIGWKTILILPSTFVISIDVRRFRLLPYFGY